GAEEGPQGAREGRRRGGARGRGGPRRGKRRRARRAGRNEREKRERSGRGGHSGYGREIRDTVSVGLQLGPPGDGGGERGARVGEEEAGQLFTRAGERAGEPRRHGDPEDHSQPRPPRQIVPRRRVSQEPRRRERLLDRNEGGKSRALEPDLESHVVRAGPAEIGGPSFDQKERKDDRDESRKENGGRKEAPSRGCAGDGKQEEDGERGQGDPCREVHMGAD